MVAELKWYYALKKSTLEGYKELLILLPKVVFVYALAMIMDVFKFLSFLKKMLLKKIVFIPFLVMLFLFFYYTFLISGKPDSKTFEDKLLPNFYYDVGIVIRDQEGRLAGSIAQPQSFNEHPSLFLEQTPDFFWSLMKEQYDPHLDFDNNATSFLNGVWQNPRYFNGMDAFAPFVESMDVVSRLLWEQEFSVRPNPTLTQQLVTAFSIKHLAKVSDNRERLGLSKTFYHQLKKDEGANFKRWLLSEKSFFFAEGKGFGFRDASEIFFGKEVLKLTEIEQIILLAMYKKTYRIDRSLKVQKEQWARIKEEAIKIVNASELISNSFYMKSQISKLTQPKIPYFPDTLMEVVGKITAQNQEAFTTLPSRSKALLGSTKEIIGQELDTLSQDYNINAKSKIITNVNINFYLNDNFYFNRYMERASENLNLSSAWVSVVNDKGEFLRIFQKNSSYQNPPEIGNLAKLFTGILFANRGDKYYTKYCNKRIDTMPSLGGTKQCRGNSWVDARRLFAGGSLLPLYDGFTKYKVKDTKGEQSHYTPIYMKEIEILYRNLALRTLQNNEPREDLGLGKLQMSPLDFQVSLHKITQLLYQNNTNFFDAKLIKDFDYHDINNTHIESPIKNFSLHSPTALSPAFQKFFEKEKKITLKTLFKTPIYKQYGTLKWMRNYIKVKFLFAQESHINGTHWLVGGFKKSGKFYSFVIHLEDPSLSKKSIKKSIQQMLELTLKSLNKPEQMKHEYMKMIYDD
ncbi:MAG: Unknown protein [uncultured Sulfurovum sp.]|uniref:Glycosyl transferase family 51 domain-containing protein n=1 Tax=uncultured Sulfurovum sp. TaxID=269237 RepID=A0A6S6SBY5_9BACT|nr:MAG: Unknown protein [uncultured Sulfurovum sp.]